MQVKYRGAVTFDTDEALENALEQVEDKLAQHGETFLQMEHIQPLGLHVTVHHQGATTQAQIDLSREILEKLAGKAYSGYVDMEVDDQSERFHAKEIDPKEISVADIATI